MDDPQFRTGFGYCLLAVLPAVAIVWIVLAVTQLMPSKQATSDSTAPIWVAGAAMFTIVIAVLWPVLFWVTGLLMRTVHNQLLHVLAWAAVSGAVHYQLFGEILGGRLIRSDNFLHSAGAGAIVTAALAAFGRLILIPALGRRNATHGRTRSTPAH